MRVGQELMKSEMRWGTYSEEDIDGKAACNAETERCTDTQIIAETTENP